MRYFNTYGPVDEQKHYVVPRNRLLNEIFAQIETGYYFTIYAPRQMGKTTLLRRLVEMLETTPNYLPVRLDFEAFESWPVKDFLQAIGEDIAHRVREQLDRHHNAQQQDNAQQQVIEKWFADNPLTNFAVLRQWLLHLHRLLPAYRIVWIVDEFDATPRPAISKLLQLWRQIYLANEPPRPLHSVVLLGIQNIAKLNLGRSSPFNIARQVNLVGFSLEEVRLLLGQYSEESGQSFAEDVVEEIYEQTGGHPFLINRLSALLTEQIATDRTKPVTLNDLRIALSRLVRESNYNFETVIRHANKYRDEVLQILFGKEYPFNLNDPLFSQLSMQGVIREERFMKVLPLETLTSEALYSEPIHTDTINVINDTIIATSKIANPIYSAVLLAAFRPAEVTHQGTLLVNGYDFRPHIVNGELQMDELLSRFRQFVERRGREAFKVTKLPQEVTGQYLLMASLDIVVRQIGGDIFSEVDSGEGRLDLIIVHRGRRYVVETKIWYGKAKFDAGLDQLHDYLGKEGEKEGYCVVFHARPQVYGKLTFDKMEFVKQHKGSKIYVYFVRLGDLIDEAKPRQSKKQFS